MKKLSLLMLLASTFALASCDSMVRYYPSHGGTYVPPVPVEEEGGGEEEEDVLMCTYNYYFSYNFTTRYDSILNKDVDAPIFTEQVPMLSPRGSIPDEVSSKEKILALGAKYGFTVDPTFPEYIGFSFNGVCLDEEGLWHFDTDYKQLAVVTLYAVWVSNE